jgi:aspartate 1-decarboxylase
MEVCISSILLSFLLILGISMSKSALASASRTVEIDAAAARLDAALDRIRAQFVATSRSTLQAIPPGKTVAEDMVDGVVYDNIRFRRVTGVSMGAPLYFPAGGQPPLRFFVGTSNLTRALMFDGGAGSIVLVPDGATATFTKAGDQIVIALSCPATKNHAAAALASAFRLLVP